MHWRATLLDMRPISGPKEVRVLWVLAIVSALLALGLGLSRIDATSLWLDETFSVVDAQRSWGDMLVMRSDRGTAVHPPLYSMVLRSAMEVCGVNETCARLPSVLGATGSCLLLVMLAGRVFGWTSAVTSAWLWPTLPYLLKYADQARGYALLLLLAAVVLVCAGRALGFWGAARHRRLATWGLGLSAAAMAATHLLAATFLVPLALALVLIARYGDDDAWPCLRRALVIAAVLITPLALAVLLAVTGDDTSRFASASGAAAGLKRMAHALVTLSEYSSTVPLLLGSAVLLVPGRRRGLVVLGLLVAVLPITPLLVRAPAHFIVLRYFMPSVGLIGLLATAGIGALVAAPGRLPRRWTDRVPLAVLLAVGLGLGVVPSRTLGQRHAKKLRKRAQGRSFEPWDEASAWVNARVEPDAVVVLVPHAILWPTLAVYPVDATLHTDDSETLLAYLQEHEPPKVFVLWSHVSTDERRKALHAVMRSVGRARYRPTGTETFGRKTIFAKEYTHR